MKNLVLKTIATIALTFAAVVNAAEGEDLYAYVDTTDIYLGGARDRAVHRKSDDNELSFIFGGVSEHFGRSEWCYEGECHSDRNETNPAIGIEWNKFSLVYIQKNSFNNTGIAAFYTFTPWERTSDFYEFGVRTGIVTGYKDTPNDHLIGDGAFDPYLALVTEVHPFAHSEIGRDFAFEVGFSMTSMDSAVGMINLKLDM